MQLIPPPQPLKAQYLWANYFEQSKFVGEQNKNEKWTRRLSESSSNLYKVKPRSLA